MTHIRRELSHSRGDCQLGLKAPSFEPKLDGAHVIERTQLQLEDSEKPTEAQIKHLRKIFYLSIAYSANIGGTSTLTSNGPNLILRFVVDNKYKGRTPIDYTNWLLFNAPAAIITVLLVWLAFRHMYLRKVKLPENILGAKNIIRQKYKELGPVT